MPLFCSVVNCGSRGERDNVRFFRIPAILKDRGEYNNKLSKERRESWIKSLKRGELSETFLKNARICSKHFITGALAPLSDKNNPDWTPSQNMGYNTIMGGKTVQDVERYNRSVMRGKRLRLDDLSQPGSSRDPIVPMDQTDDQPRDNPEEVCAGIEVQTDLNMDHLDQLFKDLNFCNSQLYTLQEKIKKIDLSEGSFVNNDTKALYLTGFPKSEMLFIVFKSVEKYFSTRTVLSPFFQFLLTMVKLRLNLPFKYLSYRFSISPKTASETFYKCIDIFYIRYKKFVVWPSRDSLQKQVPLCFRESFGTRVAVVIDCFEIFTETPSTLLNSARCWSNSTHHETVKFLIGITPQGTISYISEAWGGRTSDKFLSENCGFLNLILPGDIILADRGFLIKDSVETLGARLEIPAFTKGKYQLHPTDLENTRNIATVRIHVERIIGLLKKKYKICQGPIPISMLAVSRDNLSAIDKILVVCSAFINLCPSQIPMN